MKYKMTVIQPHKYTKYDHTELDVEYPTRQAALEAVAEFVANTIKDSARFVKRNGSYGPFAIEISNGKDTWHIPFSIVKGKFQYSRTDKEEAIMEDWFEGRSVKHYFERKKEE
jgi:hypothetical protein